MNKKAQMGLGTFLIVFISIIAGLALYGSIVTTVGDATTTVRVVNHTITFPAIDGTLELQGQGITDTIHIMNTTDGVLIPATNYTITEGLGADGLLALILTADAGYFNSVGANATYTYEPDGYIGSGGNRAIFLLIPIFTALAIAVVALQPTLRNEFLTLIGYT